MNEYATDKLASHPNIVTRLQEGISTLTTVHLMPQNACNHSCSFCSYRMSENKNSEDFNEGAHIGWTDMDFLLDDFRKLGVQGVEVTGGGEPLAYPYTERLWRGLQDHQFATALVTNGTLLKDRAPLIAESRLKWVRVSIDASTPEVYARMRKCPESHFEKAWEAVRQFREHAPKDPEFRLGVGFVLSNENYNEVYDFVSMARDNGADNVRLSSTFSDRGESYFENDNNVEIAYNDSELAKELLEYDGFHVNNLIPKRLWETAHPTQDYDKCYIKDVLCVVEGECKVYTCCTFTGSKKGCYGKFTDHPEGFSGLWGDYEQWRRDFSARDYCTVTCLYRDRNLSIKKLVDGNRPCGHLHKEFI